MAFVVFPITIPIANFRRLYLLPPAIIGTMSPTAGTHAEITIAIHPYFDSRWLLLVSTS